MEISEYIDMCMADYKDGHYTFIEGCEQIGTHPKLITIEINSLHGTFETLSGVRIIVSNKDKINSYDPRTILRIVSNVSEISMEALKSDCRRREIAEARHAYFYINLQLINRKLSSHTISDIGRLVGKNHSTVIHARKTYHLPSIQRIIKNTGILI